MMEEEKATILVVDDTETNIDILLELLSDEYDVMVALDGKSAIEIVNEDKIDLILLDIMMPQMDGYEVCSILKSNIKTKDIPIIFITAKTDEDSIEKAYEVGGIDYVTKPFKPRELLARVKTQLELKFMIEHLEYLASHDQMTGIYNRRKFFELGTAVFESKNEKLHGVMVDIDDFKNINDTYGHDIGDKVIKDITSTMKSFFADDEIFGRLGGEEFAVLFICDSTEELMQRFDNIREAISTQNISSDDKVFTCTISIGVSKFEKNMKNIDELLKDADRALYEAKGSGKNRSVLRK